MADEQQLKRLHRMMEYKSKDLQNNVAVTSAGVDGLINQKKMVDDSNHQNHLQKGERLNALLCWNQNQFSSLLSDVGHLIDEKISDHQSKLKALESELTVQHRKMKGVDLLLQKKIQDRMKKHKRNLELEMEENLQR
ncbi:hypothetical protein [Endozoicomonas ascidiicola]|uniref:hypothetical protein n=1 Tax=Endozoicomonas ascidiicola TaxID=1698521 RepID=UPI000835F3AA|nr:hypothetical protein [Endozoicomonas ascidiicola]